MNGLARALQYGEMFFGELVKLHKLSVADNAPMDINANDITALYQYVREKISKQYFIDSEWDLPPRLTKALLFGEKITVDDDVMNYIRQGVFTNSLSKLRPLGKTTIIPKTTILTMDIMTSNNNVTNPVSLQIREIVDSLMKFMLSDNAKLGYPLEIVTRGIINARLLSLVDSDSETPNQPMKFNILQLLITNRKLIKNKVGDMFAFKKMLNQLEHKFTISRSDLIADDFKFLSLRCSYTNRKKFLFDANVVMKRILNVMRLIFHPDECADAGWLFRSKFYRVFSLIIDCKSLKELPPPDRIFKVRPPFHFIKDRKQALYFMNLYNKTWNAHDGSLADSILHDNVIYVYVTTRKEKSFATQNGILILGESDTRKFLGFMEPLYTVCRSGSKAAEKEQNPEENTSSTI